MFLGKKKNRAPGWILLKQASTWQERQDLTSTSTMPYQEKKDTGKVAPISRTYFSGFRRFFSG